MKNKNQYFWSTEYKIRKALGKLSNKKSKEWDGISSMELKTYSDYLITPLLLLFNKSLDENIFPTALKHAEVVPIQKLANVFTPNNFRSISILPAISKLSELIIRDRMLDFLMKCSLFSDYQFGFLPKRNTSEAIYEHIMEIIQNLEAGKK